MSATTKDAKLARLKIDLETLRIDGFDFIDGDLVDVKKQPHVFIYRDGEHEALAVSGEVKDGQDFIDYYGEFRGGYPWIHPDLEAWAKRRGMYWEWVNPAFIALYEA